MCAKTRFDVFRAQNLGNLYADRVSFPGPVGVRPDQPVKRPESPSYPVVHCGACGAATVWAFDDRFPEDLDALHRRLVDFDPLPALERGRGDLVLWFAEGEHGPQWFRRLGDITDDFAGPVWRYHANTCPARCRR